MDEKENTKELVVVDIKHYKKVKKALVESEERYRQLFENVPIGIYRTTPDGRIVDSNPALVKMLGYESFAELANRNLEQDYAIVNLPRADFIKRLKHDGEIIGLEAIWKKKDGSHIHVRENAKLTKTEDGQVMFEGTVEDITQSKLIEAAQKIRSRQLEILNSLICSGNLADSLQELLDSILSNVAKLLDFEMAAIYLFDQVSKKVAMVAQHGLPKKFVLQDKYMSISEQPFSMVMQHGRPVFADHIGNVAPDLAEKWGWQLAGSIPLVSKGRIIGALNVASRQRPVFSTAEKDILELIGKEAGTLISKLQAETALRESEKFHRTLIDTSPDIITVVDLKGNLVMINQRFLQISGYFYDEVIGHNVLGFVQELKMNFLLAGIKRFLKTKKLDSVEYQIKKKDGSFFPMEMALSLLTDERGEPSGIMGVGRDISQRKLADEALRQSEETFRRTFEAIPDPAYICTRQGDGRVFLSKYNKAAAQVNKNYVKKLLGVEINSFFTAYPAFLKNINLAMDKGRSQIPEILFTHQSSGESRWLAIDYVKTAEDSVLMITKDITERKEAEAKLLAYQEQLRALTSEMLLVEERERRRIASELHDQIGQNLALCKLKVAALEKNLSDDALKGELTLVRRLLECSIQDARSLIFDLSPPVLYELGFAAALEWLAERIQEQFHVPVEFESRFKDPELKNDQQVILFQVVRELLINVGKHSRASQAKIILSHEGPSLKIQVNDDGVGFDASQIFAPREEKNGFGFFSMRERLNYLGGRLEVKSKPGQGTQIILTVPQKDSGVVPKRENP
jgi:PAS domain S-box-containing protein